MLSDGKSSTSARAPISGLCRAAGAAGVTAGHAGSAGDVDGVCQERVTAVS
jgi:hypothetical protein